MATRVGIELAPDACRIVEIDAGPIWARRDRATEIRSFAILPPSGPETEARLRGLRRKRVAVVVWTGGEHRQVVVGCGSYESMRSETIESLAAVGVKTRSAWLDIAPLGAPPSRDARRPVVAAFALGSELTTALQPLLSAGLRLRTVTTPAAALWSLARLRRSPAPDAIEVYVALEERVSCIATVRGGAMLAARDLGWGYIDEARSGSEPRGRDDIARRLADAITQFVAQVGGSPAEIGQVSVCGGLPELRSMTVLLTERLDVEVEPLDSLFGVDAANLPASVEEFRERGAELRLAWAAAADWPPPINLLRARNRQASKAMLKRAAVAAATAAGLIVAWRVQRSPWWRTPAPAPVRTTATVRPGGRAVVAPPPAASNAPAAPPLPANVNKPPVAPPPGVAATRPPVVLSPPAAESRPVVVPPPMVPPVAPRSMPAPPPPTRDLSTAMPTVRPAAPSRSETPAATPPRARTRTAAPPDVPLPFDAVLGTILYSPDRKLAIVDGRIVGLGDEIRGARIIDITVNTVMLRDAEGRLRRIALGARGR